MNINSVLDKIIKVLLVSIISIMLTIGFLFITPVYVHADAGTNFNISIDDKCNVTFPISTYNSASSRSAFSYDVSDYVSQFGDTLYVYGSAHIVCTRSDGGGFSVMNTQYANGTVGTGFSYTDLDHRLGVNSNTSNTEDVYNIDFVYSLTFGGNTIRNYITFVAPYMTGNITFSDVYISSSEPSNVQSFDNTVTIEPGYVAYCLCEGGSVVLNAIMPLNSNLNIAGKPKWDSMARIAFGVQRPATGTVLTDSFGNLINWQKNGTAPSNILGMTKYAQAIYNDLPADGSFVAIYNPAYYGDDMSNPTQAPSIAANFTNLGAVAKYPINTQVSYTPALGWNIQSGSDSDWSEYGIAIPTTNGAITTSDYIMSTTSQPAIVFPDGGYNDSNSVNNDPGSVLQRIIQPIINLLKAPFEHINNLISSGTAFMHEIGQFFTWLPDVVVQIIIDALIVCVVIGVLKLLF